MKDVPTINLLECVTGITELYQKDMALFDFLHRLGWIPATGVIAVLTLATIYSGYLLLRLYNAVPGAVLFGDIGEAAAGSRVSPQ